MDKDSITINFSLSEKQYLYLSLKKIYGRRDVKIIYFLGVYMFLSHLVNYIDNEVYQSLIDAVLLGFVLITVPVLSFFKFKGLYKYNEEDLGTIKITLTENGVIKEDMSNRIVVKWSEINRFSASKMWYCLWTVKDQFVCIKKSELDDEQRTKLLEFLNIKTRITKKIFNKGL